MNKYENPTEETCRKIIELNRPKKITQKIIDYYEHRLIQSGAELLGLDKVEWGNFYVGDLFDFRKKQTKGLYSRS